MKTYVVVLEYKTVLENEDGIKLDADHSGYSILGVFERPETMMEFIEDHLEKLDRELDGYFLWREDFSYTNLEVGKHEAVIGRTVVKGADDPFTVLKYSVICQDLK